MLSSQMLQKVIYDMKGITGAEVSVWELEGSCIVSTDTVKEEQEEAVHSFLYTLVEEDGNHVIGEHSLFMIGENGDVTYLLMLSGISGDVEIVGQLCANQLENLMETAKERLTKNSFIQNVLLENYLPVDLYNKAKKLHIEPRERRVVYVIQPQKENTPHLMETLRNLYKLGAKDFMTAIDENHIIYVKHLRGEEGEKEVSQIAATISDTLSAEVMTKVLVAYGKVKEEIKDVAKAYQEALMALDIGKVFFSEQTVISYSKLGIGRLIYQLPASLCSVFLDEVLVGKAFSQFDEELMVAVTALFNNNLNISETARGLYMHRNTLVYKLEKVEKITGLDVRTFEDAMLFKIAMMVSNHMNFLQFNERVPIIEKVEKGD